MNYDTWNYRCAPLFREEFPGDESNTYPSIEGFRCKNIYSPRIRELLVEYLNHCEPIVATSMQRYDPYTKDYTYDLSYYTDGEVIFNNSLFSYIKYDDFALPAKWYEIIAANNFALKPFKLDFDLIIGHDTDIFFTCEQTFDEVPVIKELITY